MTVREENWAAETASDTGIPKHLECLREAEDGGCQLGGGVSCGTLWGTWCTGQGTQTHEQTDSFLGSLEALVLS